MISFEDFVLGDGYPIYLQIIRHIKQGIAAGAIGHQEEVPSRRVLSALLGVNPNTIQKAYHMLEDEGDHCLQIRGQKLYQRGRGYRAAYPPRAAGGRYGSMGGGHEAAGIVQRSGAWACG